jgi:hypothetical protein
MSCLCWQSDVETVTSWFCMHAVAWTESGSREWVSLTYLRRGLDAARGLDLELELLMREAKPYAYPGKTPSVTVSENV